MTYKIAVHNGGTDAAQGVKVTDTLPASTEFKSATTTQGTCITKPNHQVFTCSLGTMANGADATVTIVAKPTKKGTFTNTAAVSETGPGDPNLSNNTSSVTTNVT